MNIIDADKYARHILPVLKVHDYSIVWERTWTTIAARCDPHKKLIHLSRPIIYANSFEVLSELIRHEAAHALVPFDGHNEAWQIVASRLGCMFVNETGMVPMLLPRTGGIGDVAVEGAGSLGLIGPIPSRLTKARTRG